MLTITKTSITAMEIVDDYTIMIIVHDDGLLIISGCRCGEDVTEIIFRNKHDRSITQMETCVEMASHIISDRVKPMWDWFEMSARTRMMWGSNIQWIDC